MKITFNVFITFDKKSWVYIDAGDANYLHEDDHLEHIAKTLLRVKVSISLKSRDIPE